MSWKLTAVFAALLAVAIAVYFLAPAPGGNVGAVARKIFDLQADRVATIEIAPKGGEAYSVERVTAGGTASWRIRPKDWPVDREAIQKMLWGLDRFVKAGEIERGKPEAAPELTGLKDPRLSVTFRDAAGRKETLRFGLQPRTNANAVFYEREGDPMVYLVELGTFEAYDRTPAQARSKQFVEYEAYRLMRVGLERKFTRGRQGQAPTVEYEKSTFEKLDGEEKGWFMTAPWRERIDPLKVQRLATELVGLQAEEIRPLDPKDFAEPEAVLSLSFQGREKPVVIRFGALTDLKRRRHVSLDGTGESAQIDARKFDDLPTTRGHFRTDSVFGFSRDSVKIFEAELRAGPRVRIERKETKKEGEAVPDVRWEVVEPKGLRVDAQRVEAFVGTVIGQRIKEFLGPQDFTVANLDPAEAKVSVETVQGGRHVCHFSGTRAVGYLRREGVNEVFEVEPGLVDILKNLELNFLNEEILNVPREKLREFSFRMKGGAGLEPVDFRVKWNASGGKWEFADAANRGKALHAGALDNVLNVINFIHAQAFIGRDPGTISKHQLTEYAAPATLEVLWEEGPLGGATFFIGANQGETTSPRYYALRKGTDVVFQIAANLVESLKKLPFPP